MKMEAFVPAIPEIAKTLGSSLEDGHRSAIAITTTGEETRSRGEGSVLSARAGTRAADATSD
jgi:hypothetical protein